MQKVSQKIIEENNGKKCKQRKCVAESAHEFFLVENVPESGTREKIFFV